MTANDDPAIPMNAPDPTATGFTENAIRTLRETVRERYGEESELQSGAAGMRLARPDREMTTRPVATRGGCGDDRRGFFRRVHRHSGSGIDRFDNFAEGLVTPHRVPADHAHQRRQETGDAPPR